MDNKANKELAGFVGKMLGAPRSSVRIVAGAGSTSKTVVVSNWEGTAEDLEAAVHRELG